MADDTKQNKGKFNWLWVLLGLIVIGGWVFGGDAEETADADKAESKEKAEQVEDSVETTGKLSEEELLANQKENLQKSLDEIIDDEVVLDIRFAPNHKKDGEFMQVVVSDVWYNSPKQDKERFADAVGEKVRYAVWNSGLQEQGETIVVDIVDSYDKEVASYSVFSGKYKIKE